LKFIIDERLFDRASLDLRADGFESLSESLKNYGPESVGLSLGIDPDMIKNAAKFFAEAETAVVIITEGLNKSIDSVPLSLAAVNLAVVTGHVGKESCGVYILGEKANAQGVVDMGLIPDLLPGCQSIDDESSRSKFESIWNAKLPVSPGLKAKDIFEAAEKGNVKGLYAVGENFIDNYPNRRQLETAVGKLDFLVVQDMFMSSTAKMADVILPAAAAYEKSGTFTSAERRVQRLNPSSKGKVGKTDLEIFSMIANRMGALGIAYNGCSEIMAEIASLVPMYAGISYDRIGHEGLVWPCVDRQDPGSSILYEGGFPGGKARLIPVGPPRAIPETNSSFRLIPTINKFHSGSFSEWSPSLNDVCPGRFAEMNEKDMSALGIGEGDYIKISGSSGEIIELVVKESRRPLRGTILVPYHFSENRLNSFSDWGSVEIPVSLEKVSN
ncbi:MAG: molybdopterin-dependent oxidoreductase, partial [Pseudomonadota bacterium]